MLPLAAKTRHNCHSPVHRHYRRVLKNCSEIHRYCWLTHCLGKHESQAPVAPDAATDTAEVSSVPVPIHYPRRHQHPVDRFINQTALPLRTCIFPPRVRECSSVVCARVHVLITCIASLITAFGIYIYIYFIYLFIYFFARV